MENHTFSGAFPCFLIAVSEITVRLKDILEVVQQGMEPE